jgi:murein DD-endopeptidase MepM/ murein hydrolase activator NlpD
MNLFFFSRRLGLARHFNLSHPLALGAAGVIALGVLGLAFTFGVQLGQRSATLASVRAPATTASVEAAEIARLKQQVQDRVDAISVRVGQLNAHLIRLDALGKRLTEMANISSREFNFDAEPAVGGPEESDSAGIGAIIPDLTSLLDNVQQRIQTRDAQLLALENVILSRRLNEAIRPDGRPVLEGYVSSYFGERQDPFTGHEAWHKGVDFAGAAGSEVVAVAAGIVTRSEDAAGYGNLVEINHGNGYVTRYGHGARLLVKAGDIVTRGQPVATIGSTGRSTGPHVHFEVLRNGQQVNPLSFTGR